MPHWAGGWALTWLGPLPAQPLPTSNRLETWAVAGLKVTPKQLFEARTVRGPARAASVEGGDGRVPRGTTQDLAMLMRCPEARANVSRRTTRLYTSSGCREDRKAFVSLACR
jgi:hypothetical protein